MIAVASWHWIWVWMTENLPLLERLLAGGSTLHVVLDAWNGVVSLADSLLLVVGTLVWVVVTVALTSRLLRWRPRR